ncbi:hypothetical protein BZA70DRAFT_206263 [Myxozyma melibiosi]|uniref:Uncharacterized protein n=1 Tax=Myxozyma melibiosi TaxID=54550 RepID=A0ABR1F2Z9_9ASCO
MTSNDLMKLDLDRRRVTLVLEINAKLFRESIAIQQKHGDGGGEKARHDPIYVHCMKRLQVNLAYLAGVADRGKVAHAPPYPTILVAPPEISGLVEPYRQLQDLFREAYNAITLMQQQQHNINVNYSSSCSSSRCSNSRSNSRKHSSSRLNPNINSPHSQPQLKYSNIKCSKHVFSNSSNNNSNSSNSSSNHNRSR